MTLGAADVGLMQAKYRVTKQRAAILRALGDGKHLSADAIHERVRAELPGVSLGTIYRTLDILRELGLVQLIAFGGAAARYEAALERHHHLLCDACSELTNVRIDGLAEIVDAVAARESFTHSDYTVTVFGRCADCSRK